MTDSYERIRKALEMGPTPGPWSINTAGIGVVNGEIVNEIYVYNPAVADDVAIAADIVDPETGEPSEANARLIAACDPDTIRELLAERDQLAAALEAAREDACVALVADIRFACGDNGKRMQPELVEFIRGLAVDAERYQVIRRKVCIIGGEFQILNLAPTYVAPDAAVELDAAIDQARGKGRYEEGVKS